MSNPVEIREALTLRDDTGRTVLDVGLMATLYFTNGHLIERRPAVAACFDEFFRMSGAGLRWVIPKRLRRRGNSMEQAAAALIANLTSENFDDGDTWEFDWHNGEAIDSASDLKILAYGCRPSRRVSSRARRSKPADRHPKLREAGQGVEIYSYSDQRYGSRHQPRRIRSVA